MLELINSVSQCEGGSSLLKASVQQGSDITPAGCGCSVAKLCLTLRNPMGCSTPGFRVPHYLLKFAQVSVLLIGDAIQPSHPLLTPSLVAFNRSQHQGLFQ